MKRLPILVYLGMATLVIFLVGQFHRPIISYAECARPIVKLVPAAKPRVAKPEVKRADNRFDLGNGKAMNDSEIQAFLERIPNGRFLLPHYRAVGAACRRWNVNPALVVAMFQMECNLGRRMIPCRGVTTPNGMSNNYGNLRRNSQGFKPSGTPPIGYLRVGGGPHAVFRTPADGINAYCWVLRTAYLDRGRTTLWKILRVYAPADNGNDPVGYVRSVRRIMHDAL